MPPEDEEKEQALQNEQAFRPGETPEERAKRLENGPDGPPDELKAPGSVGPDDVRPVVNPQPEEATDQTNEEEQTNG